jgi:hypothetical protein
MAQRSERLLHTKRIIGDCDFVWRSHESGGMPAGVWPLRVQRAGGQPWVSSDELFVWVARYGRLQTDVRVCEDVWLRSLC